MATNDRTKFGNIQDDGTALKLDQERMSITTEEGIQDWAGQDPIFDRRASVDWDDVLLPPLSKERTTDASADYREKSQRPREGIGEKIANLLNNPATAFWSFNSYLALHTWNIVAHIARTHGAKGLMVDYIGDIQTGATVVVAAEALRHIPGKIGKYAGEIALVGVGAWVSLGESVLPHIFPGSPDTGDIPMGLVGAALGYLFARRGIKDGFERLVQYGRKFG